MAFVARKAGRSKGLPMHVLFGNKEAKGEVGIEIECEGNKFEKESPPSPWGYHHDGSLRGHDNAEYVLKKPIDFSEVPGAIDKLWAMFAKTGTVLSESNRTSVHVHVNCQQFHMNRLTSFMAMYFVLEEILTEWCGDHRVGNLFCMRAKDAPAIVTQIRELIRTDGKKELRENIHHYAALNGYALHKFGSLEIRTLRGVNDPKIILDWVAIIERLYRLSEQFSDPRDICDIFSSEGPLAFFETLLGEQVATVRVGVPWSDDQIRNSMYDGIRMAQDLCYCRDWGKFEPMVLKEDPFNRSPKQVASSLMAQDIANAPYPEPQQFIVDYDEVFIPDPEDFDED